MNKTDVTGPNRPDGLVDPRRFVATPHTGQRIFEFSALGSSKTPVQAYSKFQRSFGRINVNALQQQAFIRYFGFSSWR